MKRSPSRTRHDRPLRAGIVGYGVMGELRRQNIDSDPDLELVGICDPRHLGRTDLGVTVVGDYEDLLVSELDVVFVCTPNHLTADVITLALARCCHVFSEKPPGRNIADVERIIAAERSNPQLKVMFGFNHRHHASVRDAKSLVDGGALGRLLWIRGVYGKSGGPGFERSWRNDPAQSGGGILLDQGIHMLDLFRFFCGDFSGVMGMRSVLHWNIPVEDNAVVILRTDSGQLGMLHSSATLWKHTFQLEIGLEAGYLVIGGLLTRSGTYGRETLVTGRRRSGPGYDAPREETTYYDADPSWAEQVRQFVRAIREDRPVEESGTRDALEVMRMVDRVYGGSELVRPGWSTRE